MGAIALLTHTDCVSVAAKELNVSVCAGFTVIVPPSVATAQAFPVVEIA